MERNGEQTIEINPHGITAADMIVAIHLTTKLTLLPTRLNKQASDSKNTLKTKLR